LVGGLLLLYHGCRLPFGRALLLAWLPSPALTLFCLYRAGLRRPPLRHLLLGLVVFAAAGAGATWATNRWSIHAGEQTIAICDGSDMFGYALVGDWILTHRSSQPPRPDRPFEVLQFVA